MQYRHCLLLHCLSFLLFCYEIFSVRRYPFLILLIFSYKYGTFNRSGCRFILSVGFACAASNHFVAPRSDINFVEVLDKRAVGIPAVLPGKWQYQGCYTDQGPRTLAAATYASGTAMTIESCIAYCDAAGYLYAGTEYSSECCKFY